MAINFAKIKEILEKSDLNQEDRDNLLSFLSYAKDKDLQPLLELFLEDEKWIKIINENLKMKINALSKNDLSLWKKVIEAEEKMLNDLIDNKKVDN